MNINNGLVSREKAIELAFLADQNKKSISKLTSSERKALNTMIEFVKDGSFSEGVHVEGLNQKKLEKIEKALNSTSSRAERAGRLVKKILPSMPRKSTRTSTIQKNLDEINFTNAVKGLLYDRNGKLDEKKFETHRDKIDIDVLVQSHEAAIRMLTEKKENAEAWRGTLLTTMRAKNPYSNDKEIQQAVDKQFYQDYNMVYSQLQEKLEDEIATERANIDKLKGKSTEPAESTKGNVQIATQRARPTIADHREETAKAQKSAQKSPYQTDDQGKAPETSILNLKPEERDELRKKFRDAFRKTK